MTSVQLADVSKSFGSVEVLSNLNLTVQDGEFMALVGPSGCGKSTLLRLIAGLDDPTSGDILMNDQWVNHLSPRERNVAMVFQSYALYPHMTVAQNIGFNLRISGASKSEIKERVAKTADILDLGDLLKRKPSQLSGGQRQRVAMGRALVRDPSVFLFDEPLSNLDAKLRVQVREEIKALHQKLRTTCIYVTHDQIEAMTLADRIVLINDGRIQQVGTPAELYGNPNNEFVAGFIGTPAMNFLNCTKSTTEDDVSFTLSNGLVLTANAIDSALPDGAARLGLRPEHLNITADEHGANTLTGSVQLIEPTGAYNQLKVSVADSSLIVMDDTLQELSVGDTVHITIDAEKIHAFAP